jgi:pantothenate kinase-related protein Tda10
MKIFFEIVEMQRHLFNFANFTIRNLRQPSQKLEILSNFILENYNKFKKKPNRPLIVGLNGIQGCGNLVNFIFYLFIPRIIFFFKNEPFF